MPFGLRCALLADVFFTAQMLYVCYSFPLWKSSELPHPFSRSWSRDQNVAVQTL